ncbi:hypothetical protein Pan216_49490 [Planctomycetes bacterium Pan216]|uniref:Uncharacterized protein n=1 Tax=Kolteria novifilia TaxID=2527975 RepID=A0A518BAQ2_9BACT|nr:hypothetical protein Pan216_49490 [Planctomycetes bacterium Pan216]
MLRVILAAVIGGLIVFVWNFVSWMVLPFHGQTLDRIPGEPAQVEEFLGTFPESGVYHYPGMPPSSNPSEQEMADWTEAYKSGPRVKMMIVEHGDADAAMGKETLTALLLDIGGAFMVAQLLALVGPAVVFYWQRVGFVVMLVCFALVVGYLPDWIWWGHPVDFALLKVADILLAWFLAGLVIAAIVDPGRPQEVASGN